jgi:DNA-binding transcriptional regulator LsrR (DeoR family)
MFLDAPPLVEAMMKEPAIAAATSRFGSLTHAVVTVGGWNAAESTMFPLVTDGMRRRLADLGVIAEFNGHLLNDAGDDVGAEFTRRCITITLEDMTSTPGLLVVAGGPGCRIALRAALRGGHIRRLITNSDTAAWLAAQA